MDRFFIYELLMLVFLNVAALLFALHLRRSQGHHVLTARLLSLALSLAFICGTAANCANGVHSPLIPSLIGLALSSAASCLALTGAPEGRSDE